MDREQVIKGIQECDLNGGLIGNCPYKGILAMLKDEEQPQIIRCKDCKHGEPCNNGEYYCEKDIGTFESPVHCPDWFCADAERK